MLYDCLRGVYFESEEDSSEFIYPKMNKDKKLYNEYNGTFGDKEHNLTETEYIAIYRYFKIEQKNFEYILKLFDEELKYVNEVVDNELLINKIKFKSKY